MRTTSLLRRITAEEWRRQDRPVVDPQVAVRAREIVAAVREGGDAALRELAGRFDRLEPDAPLSIGREALARASRDLDEEVRALLERTAGRIRAYAEAQRSCLRDLETTGGGARMGHRFLPLEVAGCYVPGGRYPLPSTALMTAVTARVAGVRQVIVASPDPPAITLAAAAIGGADAVVPVGGAQAVAALAFGTGSVPACDVIVGPGNAWVTAAKQCVSGEVRIDSLAGPSELLVVADGDSDPDTIAADLLGQAEHDADAIPGLISLDPGLPDRVEDALRARLAALPTARTARQALGNATCIVVDSVDEAIALCNRIAPEHLQWMAADRSGLSRLVNFGGLFVGEAAAEVLGDYGAGPNHVLPTGGTARSRGGLSVLDFLKMSSWLEVDDPSSLAADAAALAELEGLPAHAAAARQRLAKR